MLLTYVLLANTAYEPWIYFYVHENNTVMEIVTV